MSFQASCPACGSPVQFDVDTSVVTVCSSCRSVVGRGDGKLEDFGKVADLVQTDSPLQLGLRGKFRGVPFEIVGRTQIQHPGGGVWDEWYAAFRDGRRWGWLAEAQGRLYLTFEVPPEKLPEELPDFSQVGPDYELTLPKHGSFRITEAGSATTVAAAGEIPFAFRPGEEVRYADLSGGGRKFATIDYSDGQPQLFVGRQVTLQMLGLATAASRDEDERRVAGVQVNCPQCGGSLDLQAPDATLRVVCPFCGAASDADKGKLKYLETLQQSGSKPALKLGSTGRLKAEWLEDAETALEFRIIGFMQRSVRVDGTTYPWHEYLLYRRRYPFLWLVHSDNHWTLAHDIPAGEVELGARNIKHQNQSFRLFDHGQSRVDYVEGEFYWKVEFGEEVRYSDYTAPPFSVSREFTLNKDAEPDAKITHEVSYSRGRYLPVSEMEEAFGCELPRPTSVGFNQPFRGKAVYKTFGLLMAVAILVAMLNAAFHGHRAVHTENVRLEPGQKEARFSSSKFRLSGTRNIRVRLTNTAPGWVYVEGQLYNEQNKQVTEFGLSSNKVVFLSSVPGGEYSFRIVPTWQNETTTPASFTLRIDQGVLRWRHLLMVCLLLGIIPAITVIRHIVFEVRRWENSGL